MRTVSFGPNRRVRCARTWTVSGPGRAWPTPVKAVLVPDALTEASTDRRTDRHARSLATVTSFMSNEFLHVSDNNPFRSIRI